MHTSDLSTLPERVFGLSALHGRRSVRPGEIITFQFRAKNPGDAPTQPAELRFLLPLGWSALDADEALIPPVAPRSEHAVVFRARPDYADATTAQSRVQASLRLDDGTLLGSNVVTMHVFGHANLAGPRSGLRIDTNPDGSLRVTVTIVNEGDAAATTVHAIAPPPPGFVAEAARTGATCEELAVGATLTFTYDMVPVAPPATTVCIDDASVAHDGMQVAIATSSPAIIEPAIAAPDILASRSANRLDVRVRIVNDGWVPARDVPCAVDVSGGWRLLRGTMRADNAPPAFLREKADRVDGITIVLPLVPARGYVDVTVVASTSRSSDDGCLTVRCGGHLIERGIPPATLRAFRIDARPASSFAEPGATMAVAVDAHNTGETTETVTLHLNGEPCWQGDLRPGAATACLARVIAPEGLADGDRVPVDVHAIAADGATLARTGFDLRAIDRPWIAIDAVEFQAGATLVTVRNVGATPARAVRIDGTDEALIDVLDPGKSAAMVVPAPVARHGALVTNGGRPVAIGWNDRAAPVAVVAEFIAPSTSRSGERIDVRLRLRTAARLESLIARPAPTPGVAYVAGSTTINGYAIVDGIDGPPLLQQAGLALHDIPAEVPVELAWSLLPHAPGVLVIGVELEANGEPVTVAPANVLIANPPAFGARPNALPFHIDAPTVSEAANARPAFPPTAAPSPMPSVPLPEPSAPIHALRPADGPAITTSLALDAVAVGIVRILRGARGAALIGHVPSLAVLFPDTITSGDAQFNATFAGAGIAIRGLYERLFVKLRIPGYDVTANDLESEATRRDLLVLLERISSSSNATNDTRTSGSIYYRIDRAHVESVRRALNGAPLGAPQTLAAIAALLPRDGSSEAARAVGVYVGELANAFERACDVPAAAFASFLTTHEVNELNEARTRVLALLETASVSVPA